MGLFPPKDMDFRLIYLWSFPDYDTINYFIDLDIWHINYGSIDEAVSMVQLMGQEARPEERIRL